MKRPAMAAFWPPMRKEKLAAALFDPCADLIKESKPILGEEDLAQ
jgi:hypothetical protein